jgi:hypothetical protein
MMRYARYAAAVLFTSQTVGFVALWVRSYTWGEEVCFRKAAQWPALAVFSGDGRVGLTVHSPDAVGISGLHYIGPHRRHAGARSVWSSIDLAIPNLMEFGAGWTNGSHFLMMLPYWFLAASSLGLAALFAFKPTWHYSLRTILVATTLLAGLLGLAVYAV